MKALVVLACLLACPMLDARAEILFSQTEPEQPNAAFSSNDTPSSQKIADNFIIAGPDPAFVRSVRFLGGYISLNPSPGTVPSDRFRITFYEGTADGPGAPLAEADILAGAAVLRQPTGGVDLNGTDEPFEYFVDLEDGILLQPATEYWISIANNVSPNNGWVWARAFGVIDNLLATTSDELPVASWSVVESSGMFFELSSVNIPEPSALSILLCISCSGLLLRRSI